MSQIKKKESEENQRNTLQRLLEVKLSHNNEDDEYYESDEYYEQDYLDAMLEASNEDF